ncbi:MAG TPA: hypothetical protein VF231_09715 [Candidatus Limnocylindrales bacterium]
MSDNKDELRATFAAGETEALPPAPPSRSDQVRKDMTYSPASETETQHKQDDPVPETVDDDISAEDVRAVPGTGGPDDVGDVDVDEKDLNLPWRQ